MLSILIPTYNYNALPLAQELERQALALNITFELICIDDGSFSLLNKENQKINALTNCKFIEAKENIGRSAMRLKLACEAQYNNLLLLDADVFPKDKLFLKNYLDVLKPGHQVYFGGFYYRTEDFTPDKSLRYVFGKKREQVPAKERNENPYKVIISANFLIDKSVYLNIMSHHTNKSYGMDYFFGARLKKNTVKILHLDNEVYHYGIDPNHIFLDKTEKAIQNLYRLEKEKLITTHSIGLLKTFNLMEKLHLTCLMSYLFKKTKNSLKKNLLGTSPNLFFFDLFRLGYLSSLKFKL